MYEKQLSDAVIQTSWIAWIYHNQGLNSDAFRFRIFKLFLFFIFLIQKHPISNHILHGLLRENTLRFAEFPNNKCLGIIKLDARAGHYMHPCDYNLNVSPKNRAQEK